MRFDQTSIENAFRSMCAYNIRFVKLNRLRGSQTEGKCVKVSSLPFVFNEQVFCCERKVRLAVKKIVQKRIYIYMQFSVTFQYTVL